MIDVSSYVIEKLEAAVLELPQSKKLLSDIRELDSRLIQTDSSLDEVKSHISTWDRINVFSKTDAEEMEEDLQDEIGEQSEKMVDLLIQLDEMLRGVARDLLRIDESVRQYVIWSELHRLQRLISGIEVEYDPLTRDYPIRHSLKGKAESMKLVAELEEITRLSLEDPVPMGTILQEVKKKLIDRYYLSPEGNY